MNVLAHCLLACRVCDETSVGNLNRDPLCVMSHFPLAAFKILSIFQKFVICCVCTKKTSQTNLPSVFTN